VRAVEERVELRLGDAGLIPARAYAELAFGMEVLGEEVVKTV
jgi:hypothetical protein